MPAKSRSYRSSKPKSRFKSSMRLSKFHLLLFAVVFAAIGGYLVFSSKAETKRGRFVVRCESSHFAQIDPIVAPGRTSGHLHEFFGNKSVNMNSTYSSMIAAGTSCGHAPDTAGYWVPALLGVDGKPVNTSGNSAYYFNDPASYSTTQPFPKDLRMLAGGDQNSLAYNFWTCKGDSSRLPRPLRCDSNTFPRVVIQFPNCWDGKNLDSPDHRSHMTYPKGNGCPSSHPVKLPHLKLYIRYPNVLTGKEVFSDGYILPHADFWNTWQQSGLETLVKKCLNAGVMCGQQR